ncbi:MAG: 4-(cytidine 5'-diphospho)-2-C-methyl-D-erythritol kinase [Acidobacteriota bacterium]
MTAIRRIRVRAHAKINLTLRVGALRPDGYHGLETVFQTLALHDTVVAEAHRGPFALRCDDPNVPLGRANLAWRAAEALWDRAGRAGRPRGARVVIRKRVPMQAGLGGGSSDAAATLLALNDLWRLDVDAPALSGIGATLGADVPSFLVGGAVLGLGRGDEVYPLADASSFHVVLAFPPFGVATRDAYHWLDVDRTAAPAEPSGGSGLISVWPGRCLAIVNDLAGPVSRRHPEIGLLRETLRQSGAVAAEMTGSGSCVFGLFRSLTEARRGSHRAASDGAWTMVTRTIARRRRRAGTRR